jgi:hypothetical protein
MSPSNGEGRPPDKRTDHGYATTATKQCTGYTDDSLRQLLLKEHRRLFGLGSRWHIPGHVSDYERPSSPVTR